MRGRYAPSPTGGLHLGNARTALVAWWRARAAGSSFVLRVEDLDGPRTVPGAIRGNLAELRWLGIDWDEGPDVGGPFAPYRQSERSDRYRTALETLTEAGHTFACYLSRKDLREIASAPHGRGAVYGPAERRANARLGPAKRDAGKTPSVRFRVRSGGVAFDDGLAGPHRFDAETEVGDVVVRRADGVWAYQLAVVVDDHLMGIEEVVRGDDLIPATAAQLLLYEALGWPPPRFFHVPLLLEASGDRMAKRDGARTLSGLREAGARPEAVVGLLAHSLGLLGAPGPATPQELLPVFAERSLRRDPSALDPTGLARLAPGLDAPGGGG